jgi:hypothetical protein
VSANDILCAAGTVHEAGTEPNSELVAKVVLPVLSVAEQEFGQALSRISLDDMVHRAALNGNGTGRHESGVGPHVDLEAGPGLSNCLRTYSDARGSRIR